MKAVVVAVLVALIPSSGLGLTQAYSVEPVTAAWSGMADPHPDYGVSQIITCNFDELDSTCYVELFVGANGDTGSYKLEIKEGNTLVASQAGVSPGRDYAWLMFGDIQMEPGESFTKGKQYEFRFTRAGADSIEYYWDAENPYPKYGWMKVGGTDEYGLDLCMRAYGQQDSVSSDW